ncbi:amidohydrolase family protein, partial [Actinocorallia lasiicapitis]
SEQPAENEACLAAYGRTPARLLADAGALGPLTVAVHATHLTGDDIGLLGATMTGTCMCPTTERDLADGIGPAKLLQSAGSPLSLGSDQHAVIDLFEEARALELDERLATRRRGTWTSGELLTAATSAGHSALGWPEAGRLEPGAYADLVTVSLDSVRLAGTTPDFAPESVVYAATAADVSHVVVSGRPIVAHGAHRLIPDLPQALAAALREAVADF